MCVCVGGGGGGLSHVYLPSKFPIKGLVPGKISSFKQRRTVGKKTGAVLTKHHPCASLPAKAFDPGPFLSGEFIPDTSIMLIPWHVPSEASRILEQGRAHLLNNTIQYTFGITPLLLNRTVTERVESTYRAGYST